MLICIYFIISKTFLFVQKLFVFPLQWAVLCPLFIYFLLDFFFSSIYERMKIIPLSVINVANIFSSLPDFGFGYDSFLYAKLLTFYAVKISIFTTSGFYHAYIEAFLCLRLFKNLFITSSNPCNEVIRRMSLFSSYSRENGCLEKY